VFFYGQSYMGSLDATLIAAAFALFGQSVLVIRLVQTALFLALVATTYPLGIRILHDRWQAGAGMLLIALPTVLMSTYSTATLGGYGEILLLGNVMLLLGHTLATDRPNDWRAWLGLGAAAGLGFWTSALIGVYLLPVGILVLGRCFHRPAAEGGRMNWRGVSLAAIAFLVCSGPWWWHNLTHDWSALQFMLTGTESSGIGIGSVPFSTRLVGLALLGLPSLMGLRFPWSAGYLIIPLSALVLIVYLAAFGYALRQAGRQRDPGRMLLLGVAAAFAALFLFSRFGTDATGRYFLPLAVPLALWTATLLGRLRENHPLAATLVLGFLLAFNLLGNGLAVYQNPPGLTTQFDPSNRFDNSHDDELVSFLREIDVTRGYSNYFVAFRIAFLSGEEIILSSQLPYKPDLSYNPADDRYPPYTTEVDRAEKVVYITSIHPKLDMVLADRLATAGVEFVEKQIGPYHLFYDLTRKVTPQELGLGHP
jgi:4-amino-4-deoxy-L-arabinose transferase-like glycosyltransferase